MRLSAGKFFCGNETAGTENGNPLSTVCGGGRTEEGADE